MLINSDCTLYRFNKATSKYDRVYIKKVYWRQNKAGNVLKSGLQTAASTTVYFYDENVPKTPTKDMLVKGNCPFVFTSTTESALSDEMKQFRANYDFVVVKSVDNMMYGGLPHYEVSAD